MLLSSFKVPKTEITATHYFIMKISTKRQLQQKASNHSSNIEFIDFMLCIALQRLYQGDIFIFSERYKFTIRYFIKI